MLPALVPVLLTLVTPAVLAAGRVALVIGNDAYLHASPLDAAVNDARAVAARLAGLDFDVLKVENGDVETMLEAVETLKRRAADAQAVLLYYAGHGIEAQGVNYLIPVDATLEREVQLKTQTLSLDDILGSLKSVNVPARMVILDCCRNNPIQGRAWLATRSSGGGLAGLAQDSLAEATLVVYSASPGKPALDRVSERDAHSPFTTALLAEMPRPGVHSFEMFGRVEDAVIQSTGGRQAPRLFYNGSTQPFRTFTFANATSASAPADTPPPAPTPMPDPAPMVAQTPPPVMPVLPASGYFDLEGLFLGSPYAGYNSYTRGQILKRAQQGLKAAGHYASSADGAPGPGTQRAILAYQQANGLPLSGRLDSTTLQSLGLTGIQPMAAPAPKVKTQGPATSPPKPSRPTRLANAADRVSI